MSELLSGIDLNKLHTFLSVAEAGGVTAAARRLALTPSAVSQSLSGLEASLGVSLFHRVGRRMVLTPQGRLLARRFREHAEALEGTLSLVTGQSDEPQGPVRIGLSLGFPRAPLADFVAGFAAEHPAVQLRLRYGSRAELNDMLLEGGVEFVLSFDPEGASGGRIRSTRLFEQELLLTAIRGLRPRGGIDLEKLRRLPVVDYYRGDPLIHRWIGHHFRRRPPALDVRVWAATTDLVLDLVLRGTGVGVLPRAVAEAPLRERQLVALAGPRADLSDRMWLKELEGARHAEAARRFRARALSTFSDPSSPYTPASQ